VEDATIFVDADFDPLDGVTATDDTDGDITADITVSGTVNTAQTGVYYLLYRIEDSAGNSTQKARYITVEVDPSLIGDDMVPNGDFSLGWSLWEGEGGGVEGGYGTFAVVDEVLEVTITAPSWNMWEPRLSMRGITFEQGKTYLVTFDAKADAARSIHLQVGEILSAAPWFTNFKPGQEEIRDLSTEWQTFTYKFTMTEETNENGALIFEMGTVEGGVGTDNLATKIYYDNISIVESTPDPDTREPLISGADDLTILQGSDFDPLEGVTAIDNLDGELTLTLDNVTGEVDTLTVGAYTITYTISDEAGNEAEVERVITVIAINFIDAEQIVDGGFDSTTEIVAEVQDESNADITAEDIWYQYTAGWDGAAATFSIVEGAAVVDVTAAGNNDWGVMLKQKGVDLYAGNVYKLVFTASSTVERDMIAKVTDNFAQTFQLTSTPTTFEMVFVYDGETVTDVMGERILFLLGKTPAFAAGVVTIDDVALYIEGEEAPEFYYVDTEQVVDPGFDSTTEIVAEVQNESNADITAEDIWYQYTAGWNGAAATFSVVEGAAVVDITAVGDFDWGVMLKQKGIELMSGVTYRLVFTASSTVERDIVAKVTDNYFEIFELTTEAQQFEFHFTADADVTGERILFLLGKTAAFAAGVVTIDDVALHMAIDPTTLIYNDGANMVVDPGFDSTTEIVAEVQNESNADITAEDIWYQYTAGWNGAAANFSVVEGAAVVDITAVGDFDWGVMLKQKGIDLISGTVYRLMFTASSTVDRDIVAKVTDNYFEVFELTATPETFVFEFLYDGDDVMGERILFLLGKTAAFAAGVVTIDDVTLVPAINPAMVAFVDSTQVVDPGFDSTTEIVAEVQNESNADITAEDIWYQYTAGWNGAAANFSVVEGAAVVDITAVGDFDWGVMLKQKGIELTQGMLYRLTFTASATVERDIVAKVTDHHFEVFHLSTEPTEFSFTFLHTGDAVTGERILFLLGATPEFAAGIVTIDNVVLHVEQVVE
jgi:cytochrome c oxidase assembly protein Cox11